MGRKKVKTNKKRRKNHNQDINFDDQQSLPDQARTQFQSSPATTSSTPPEVGGQDFMKTQDFQSQVNQCINQLSLQCNNDKVNQAAIIAEKNMLIANQYKAEIFDLIKKIYMDCLDDLRRIDSGEELTSDFEVNENVLAQIMFIQKCYSIKQFLIDLTDLAQQFVEVIFNIRKFKTELWRLQRKISEVEGMQTRQKSAPQIILLWLEQLSVGTNAHCKQ